MGRERARAGEWTASTVILELPRPEAWVSAAADGVRGYFGATQAEGLR